MNNVTQQKVNEANNIINSMNLPHVFQFASYDLKTYSPSLSIYSTNKKFIPDFSCQVSNNIVLFYFQKYPIKDANNYEEYLHNQYLIKEYDCKIDALNKLQIEVPKYIKY